MIWYIQSVWKQKQIWSNVRFLTQFIVESDQYENWLCVEKKNFLAIFFKLARNTNKMLIRII